MGEAIPQLSNPDLAFGKAIGNGIQCMLTGGSLEDAWMEAFKAWDCYLLEAYERSKKSFANALHALKVFSTYADILREDWEVFEFNRADGTPRKAIELSAVIHCPNGFRYRLFIDVVLRNKKDGRLVVLELKTTKFKKIDEAMYKNSNQALGYGVVLDTIAPGNAEYSVWYYVYSSENEDWEPFDFIKTPKDKAEWIKTVLHDIRGIHACLEDDFFPKHGENCFDFFRQCEYYGTCDMSKRSLYAGPNVIAARIEKEMQAVYDFEFTLEQLIDQQLKDLEEVS